MMVCRERPVIYVCSCILQERMSLCQLKVCIEIRPQILSDWSLNAESGNMLIMALSYVQRTNDTSLITSYVRYSHISVDCNG